MSNLTEFSSQAREQCPSLRNHQAYFLLILASYGIHPQETNYALDEWATSDDGRNWYRSLMSTFWTTKEAAICVLAVAVSLRVPPYQNMSSAPGAHPPSIDPLLELGTFVEGQGPNKRKLILEQTAFSAIRVLTDENFQLRFQEPQQMEHKYLSQVLSDALDKNPTLSGCLEGVLDRYWVTKFTGPTDHTAAYKISLFALTAAKYLPQGKTTPGSYYTSIGLTKGRCFMFSHDFFCYAQRKYLQRNFWYPQS
jgi:hypothetical protein